MKYGVCQSFNLPLVQNLYKDYESLSTAFQFGSLGKIRELVMEAFSELDSSRKPYSTRHKDLGLKMEIFEGGLRFSLNPVFHDLGFKVFVHHPFELPDETNQYFTLSLNHSYMIFVKPQLKTIDDTLLDMSPQE